MDPSKDTRVVDISHVDEDIVGRVMVQRSSETLLVLVSSNETDAVAKYKDGLHGNRHEVDRYTSQ